MKNFKFDFKFYITRYYNSMDTKQKKKNSRNVFQAIEYTSPYTNLRMYVYIGMCVPLTNYSAPWLFDIKPSGKWHMSRIPIRRTGNKRVFFPTIRICTYI